MQIKVKYCLACDSTKVVFAFRGIDRLHNIEGSFDVMKCENCGTFHRAPSLDYADLDKYYPPELYRAYLSATSRISRMISRFGWAKKRRYVERFVAKGRLLDVGCATGGFLDEMRRNGWDVNGVEPNESAAAIARGCGHHIVASTLANAGLPPETRDVITMWHVLEHVRDPIVELREAGRVLRKDGHLVLCVPNTRSFDARLFRHYWAGFDVPRHSYAFSREGLGLLLQKAGFRVVDVRSFCGGFSSLNTSLEFYLNRASRYTAFRKCIAAVTRSLLFRVLSLPLLYLLDITGWGSVSVYTTIKVDT